MRNKIALLFTLSVFMCFIASAVAELSGDSPVLIKQADSTMSVIEGDTAGCSYTISLRFQPDNEVIVIATPDEQLDLGFGQAMPALLTFDAGNWSVPQIVTVVAYDDDLEESDPHTGIITHLSVSQDDQFNKSDLPDLVVTISDNKCGLWGYHNGDLNYDCFVNIGDFAILAVQWLNNVPVLHDTVCKDWLAVSKPYAPGATVGTVPGRFVAYLMPYFDGGDELLRYAYSYDARNWVALNNGKPLPWSPAFVRDPYMYRVNGKFHLVHTTGWSGTTIGHWESIDLINWTGGSIEVVGAEQTMCWAPEFYYEENEGVFYVYWASVNNGHNSIYYFKTKDWTNITPAGTSVFYDIGIHDIDLTIVKYNDLYYGFHKAGDIADQMGNRMSVSTSLDPAVDSFADDGYGQVVFTDETKPTEGPEVVKLIDEEKWYVYGDPFYHPLQAWETTDFKTFEKISVNTPSGAKHCSFVPITQAELDRLLAEYE